MFSRITTHAFVDGARPRGASSREGRVGEELLDVDERLCRATATLAA